MSAASDPTKCAIPVGNTGMELAFSTMLKSCTLRVKVLVLVGLAVPPLEVLAESVTT